MMTGNDFEHDLISIVAHDLKTPIAAVKGFIQMIHYLGPLNEAQKKFADRALGGLDRMEHLIANLLDLSRIEQGLEVQMVPCNLHQLLHDSAELIHGMAALRSITIDIKPYYGTGNVIGDARMLSLVVNNLIGNAVKYNRDGGKVTVTLTDDPRFLQVDIRDTGMGIAESDIAHIFERFFRAAASKENKIEGSGLGLAIVEAIIHRHEGRIWVESKQGEGSTFSFSLPRAQPRHHAPTVMRDRDWSSEESDGVDDSLQDSSEALEIDSKEENV